jgi:aryl-alcohol dehydrogenase-like predicted oxidoreductase
MPFNLVERGAAATLRACRNVGISTLVYGPLAQGFLAGHRTSHKDFGPDDRRSRLPHFRAAPGSPTMHALNRVCALARRTGRSPAQVALRWVLDTPFISSAIVGIKGLRQVRENAAAAAWRLSPLEWKELAGDMPPSPFTSAGDASNLVTAVRQDRDGTSSELEMRTTR